jgi:riboflavin transporter FmnP
MQFDFSVPFMPSFIKMDLSDLPALIGSFSMGPLYGVIIALVKNLLHLLRTSTGGIGELSNFLLSALFVLPAGLIYQKNKTRKRAIIGAVVGAVCMAVFSVITNYFIVYPVYTAFMPMETIIAMYQAILPKIKDGDLLSCLVIFNMPFTFVKAMLSVVITLLIYKPLSPIIHGE